MTILKTARRILVLLVPLAIFSLLFYYMDFAKAGEILRRASVPALFGAGLLSPMFPLLCAIRWNLIVLRLGARLGVWESFKIVMAAWPLGSITPAKSGDLVKLLFLRHVLSYTKTTGVILAERLWDVIVLCLFAVGAGLAVRLWAAVWVGVGLLAGLTVVGALVLSPWSHIIPLRLRPIIQDLMEASRKIYTDPFTLVCVLTVTAFNWTLSLLQTSLCYYALGSHVPFSYMAAALPLAIFIGLIPVTISGMGTRDSAMIALFAAYAPFETNVAVGILYSIFGYWLLTLLGLPFMKAAFEGSISGIEGEMLRHKAFTKEPQKSETTEHKVIAG